VALAPPTLDLSIVIPLYNEKESLKELYNWITKVVSSKFASYELIFVDDGSNDGSWEVICQLKQQDPEHIRGIRFQRNYGKSAALNTGFKYARGKVVITMDADLQDSPDEIPELYHLIEKEHFHLVSGWKKIRHDPLSKTLPSKLFNFVTRLITGIPIHDFNCGLKAYHYTVVKSIEIYGEMHRYIPFIAKAAGFTRIGEKVVHHYPRKYGTSKFGWERFVNGFLDLLTLTFLLKFGRKPMHFFGTLGILSFLVGTVIVIWLIWEKLSMLQKGLKPREVVDQPLFYLAITAVIIGSQLFLAGFLGELIVRNFPERNLYLIAEEI